MKRLILLAATILVFTVPAFAQNVSSVGGELNGLRATSKQYHVTANTTINVATSTCKLYGIYAMTTNAGTTWALTASAVSAGNQSAAATLWGPVTLVLNSGSAQTTGTIPITGLVAQGGINLTFSGTAGVSDIWVVYK